MINIDFISTKNKVYLVVLKNSDGKSEFVKELIKEIDYGKRFCGN